MSLHDKEGNRLYRKVEIRILYPENVLKPEHIIQHAPAGKGFSEENINDILMQVADKLETLYPWWEFEPVELTSRQPRTSKHVFSFKGYATKSQTTKESSEPGTEAAADATPATETVGNTEPQIPAASELGAVLSPFDPRAQDAA